jgi:hypothetical protein
VVIKGENHHVLEALQFTHAGKVDCIYIDPPHNTGARDCKSDNNYVDDSDAYRHKHFVDDEGFAHLGRSHRLRLDDSADTVLLDRGRFVMSSATAQDGPTAMQDWYTATGRRWLRHRVRPWPARLGVEQVTVEGQDLGYRWGSARPSPIQSDQFHW